MSGQAFNRAKARISLQIATNTRSARPHPLCTASLATFLKIACCPVDDGCSRSRFDALCITEREAEQTSVLADYRDAEHAQMPPNERQQSCTMHATAVCTPMF
jgi:hypothetical protein